MQRHRVAGQGMAADQPERLRRLRAETETEGHGHGDIINSRDAGCKAARKCGMTTGFKPTSDFRQADEVLQQLQADLLALFRVELRGENIVAPDRRRKVFAVIRARGDDARIHRLWKKTVDEINVAAAGNAAIQRTIRPHNLKLVPASLWNFQPVPGWETDDFARKNSHAGGAGIELLALLKQGLIADADAEKRFAGLDECARGFQQFLFAQRVDAV